MQRGGLYDRTVDIYGLKHAHRSHDAAAPDLKRHVKQPRGLFDRGKFIRDHKFRKFLSVAQLLASRDTLHAHD